MNINPELLAAIEKNQKWIEKKCRICERNKTKAEELVNDVLVNLYGSSKNFSKKESVNADAWIKKITTNVTASYISQEIMEKRVFDTESEIIETEYSNEDSASYDLQVTINYINNKMPDKDREIMSLYLMQESHANIAEIIGLEVSTITNRISLLKKKLNDFINKGQL
jgi:RNA polymerase sigma factor (sigma-70 family)